MPEEISVQTPNSNALAASILRFVARRLHSTGLQIWLNLAQIIEGLSVF